MRHLQWPGRTKEKRKTEAWCRVAGNLARVVHFLLSRRNARHSGRARDQRREHAIFFFPLFSSFFFFLFFFSPLAEARDFPEEVLKGDLRDSARANCCWSWQRIVYAGHDLLLIEEGRGEEREREGGPSIAESCI